MKAEESYESFGKARLKWFLYVERLKNEVILVEPLYKQRPPAIFD